jgi:DNA-binding IclR family transcriptional regulator
VLVSDLEPDELDALGLEASRAAVAEVRRRGYAIVVEEFEPGVVAAAAPIRDGHGRVVAAVNVSAPRFRFGGRLDEAATLLVSAADRLSRVVAGSAPA